MAGFVFVPTGPAELVPDGPNGRVFCRGCQHYTDRPELAYGLGLCSHSCHGAATVDGSRESKAALCGWCKKPIPVTVKADGSVAVPMACKDCEPEFLAAVPRATRTDY